MIENGHVCTPVESEGNFFEEDDDNKDEGVLSEGEEDADDEDEDEAEVAGQSGASSLRNTSGSIAGPGS